MPLGDLLRNGANNLSSAAARASSGLQSFDVNQFNAGLTRGLDQLGGNLGQAGGLLEQAGSLASSAQQSIRDIGLPGGLGRSFSNLDQTFAGSIERLSRSNVINTVEGLNITRPDFSSVSNLFERDTVTSTLSGVRQNISVLPESFSSVTSGLSDLTGAISDLSSASAGIRNTFESIGNYDDAILRQLRLNPEPSGRADSLGTIQQVPSESGTGLRIANPLRAYASYNYILELACISPEDLNSPEDSYRNQMPNSIVRSGGGNYNNRVTTFNEEIFGSHAEYFIDDFMIDSVVTPNPNTGVTQGTNIEFKITEPYSMGQFLESLQIAAVQAGYENYIDAAYVIKISFMGLDQDGRIVTNFAAPPRFIPINLTNIEFEVRAEGSVYAIKAIPYNELALTSQTAVVRTDVTLTGRTVIEALETGNPANAHHRSLTDILNGRGESLADAGVYNTPDRYIIMFPNDRQGATAAVRAAREADTGRQQGATSTITETEAAILGQDAGLFNAVRAQGTTIIPDGAVFDTLQRYARTSVNAIGRSPIIDNVNQDGDRPHSPYDTTVDPYTSTANRNVADAQMDDTTRNGQYTQNTSIISIIENMVLTSEWGRQLAEQQGTEEGLREWFRIETQVFLETDPGTQRARGMPPRIYVYSVVPYFPDEAKFQGASTRPTNTQGLAQLANKEYNYYYTGLNEDVLDFNIEFKTAFFQNLFADLGQFGAGLRSGSTNETVAAAEVPLTEVAPPGIGPVNNGQLSEPNTRQEEITRSTDHANGGIRMSQSVAAKAAVAQTFHDTLINGDTDMINAEMEIWGDPYFLPTSGMGNYNAASSGRPGLTADGSMDAQSTEVLVIVNFRTPFDYNVRTGMMQFSTVVKPFSGIYELTKIENNFSGGKFTQRLKMIRRRGQGDQPTGNTDALTIGNRQPIGPASTPPGGQGTTGQPNNSGATTVPAPGTAGGTGGSAGVTPPPPRGPVGEPIPTESGGNLSTITTSIRGLQTQVATALAENLQGLINELEQDYGYEIRSIGGYVDRYIRGTTRKSWHASGIAIDINPYPDNADGRVLTTNLPNPPNGSEMVALAAKYGLGWGGAWTGGYFDAMHFSAATNEQGSYIVERGTIPRAPVSQG